MDLETFKTAIGIEEVEDFDTQIEFALSLNVNEPTEVLVMLGTLCLLEGLNPEIAAITESWTISVTSEKYKLPDGTSWCERYHAEKNMAQGTAISLGQRSGLPE